MKISSLTDGMQRVVWRIGVVASCALLMACGSDAVIASSAGGSGGQPGAGGMGGTGASGGQGGDGGQGAYEPLSCVSSPGDHSTLCDGSSPCPVLVDRIIECNQPLGHMGVPVLATANDVIATAIHYGSRLSAWSVTADDAVMLTELPDQEYLSVNMAVDDAGVPTIAAHGRPHSSSSLEPGELTMLRREGSGFVGYELPVAGGVEALAIDAAGTHQLVSPTNQGHQLLTGIPGGVWQMEPAPHPSDSIRRQYAISADGGSVGYGMVSILQGYQLYAVKDGQQNKLGNEILNVSSPEPYLPFGGPSPTEPNPFPRYGAVFLGNNGLRVSWAGNTGWGETPVPNTGPSLSNCPEWGGPPPCPADCQDTGSSGLEHEAFFATRGSGMTLWLTYVITHVDRQLSYTVQDINGQQYCGYEVVQDNSTFDLVVARAPLDGTAPSVVMSLPFDGQLAEGAAFYPNIVAAHAYAGELAVWMRARPSDSTLGAVRVLRIDTSLLPP